MSDERYLVTGATGCIGAWVVKQLVKEGVPVWACSRSPQKAHRLRLIMGEEELKKIRFVSCDVSDFSGLDKLVREEKINSIIHLAGLQVPFCAADPVLGAQVNVVGTVNLFETALRNHVERFVFSSSTAVYGKTEDYGTEVIDEDMPLMPASHYGIYKQANEGTAGIYWKDNGFPSLGLRPYVAYGPGRDQGMTSTPTKAIAAAVLGKDYEITFGGSYCFQYVEDIAAVYLRAARTPIKGARTYNIGGETVSSRQVVEEVCRQIPGMEGRITVRENVLPFPPQVDNRELQKVLGTVSFTPLSRGIGETIRIFRRAQGMGNLTEAILG